MKFADNLKRLRKSKNISQEELAHKVGVSRQSVSKWETSEAYPEMNNILQLCKIFHCTINDLINDNIIDLNSLDEDVKMSIVKFKKAKQKKMKGISKVLSLIGKISGIVARVGLVFSILAIIVLPFCFKYLDVKDGKLIATSDKIRIIQYENNSDIRIGSSTAINGIRNSDINKIATSFEKYSKTTILVLIELGLVFLVAFLITLIKLLRHLELLFDNINNGETPFTLDNVNHIKKMSYLMIACIAISSIGETILNIPVNGDFSIDLFDIVEILFLYSMSLIFEYGYEIQLDSKGRIYGEENE